MKKYTLRRMLFGILQHLLAMGIFIGLAMILFNSYLTVQTMDGQKTYALSPLNRNRNLKTVNCFRTFFVRLWQISPD